MAASKPLTLSHYDGCLDLFRGQPTNVLLEGSHTMEYLPTNFTAELDQYLIFDVPPSDSAFIDLSQTQLFVKCKLVRTNGNNIVGSGNANPSPVSVINNVIGSLWSQLDVWLGGHLITDSCSFYGYQAMMETLLNTSPLVRQYQGVRQGFYDDLAGNYDDLMVVGPENMLTSDNIGLRYRQAWFDGSRTASFIGPLHCGLFHTEKLLIPGVSLRIRLIRAPASFVLMAPDANQDFKLRILEASLHLRYVNVLPSAHHKITSLLRSNPVLYPLRHTVIKAYHIANGSQSHTKDALFLGPLPELLILGFVSDARCVGSFTRNPYLFAHFDIASINVSVNNVSLTGKPIMIEEGSDMLLIYNRLFTQLGLIDGSHTNGLRLESFRNNYCFFCYNFKPDGSDSTVSAVTRTGSVRVDLTFHAPLDETVTVLAYAQFSKVLSINNLREIVYDFVP